MTAGVVSAEVALLTGEVMKMMLLTKIKAATAMLLVASAFAFGGTGLAYRAGADEPAREGSTRRPGDPALALVLAGGAGVMEDDLTESGRLARRIGAAYARVRPSVVLVEGRVGSSRRADWRRAGVVVTGDGLVLCAAAGKADSLDVVLSDGRRVAGRIVGRRVAVPR